MYQWYKVNNSVKLISPSLLVYPERIKKNIDLMIEIAGGTDFLRPHIKTHKMAEVIKLQMNQGIFKFKCATIAEAELLAKCGAKDILLAMQPVSFNIDRYISLIKAFPDSIFSTLVDHDDTIQELCTKAAGHAFKIQVWLDINNGMNRTGIIPGGLALDLYQSISKNKNLIVRGLHVYDGHIKQTNLENRRKECDQDFESVNQLAHQIEKIGLNIPSIVAGGTPTFPIHCKRENIETSPGTCLLWDADYLNKYKDLPFLPAAVLFTRIVSKPNKNIVCFDLGHKSVAPEKPLPRIEFLELKNSIQLDHSEEHLTVESINNQLNIGDAFYALPMHVCPTIIKYKEAYTVSNNKINGSWKVAARDQIIYI